MRHESFYSRMKIAACFLMSLAMAGCVGGPQLKKPQVLSVSTYTEGAMETRTVSASVPGGESQEFVSGQEIPAQWWRIFQCPELDVLVRMAMDGNPGLEAAHARLRQAQEMFNVRSGMDTYPQVNANSGVSRQKTSLAMAGISEGKGSQYDLYNASVSVGYVFDIFGEARHGLEGLAAQVDHQKFQVEAAQLALTANVVTTAVMEASVRAQTAAVQEIIDSSEKQLQMLEKQLDLGGIGRGEVLAQKADLQQIKAQMPALHKQLAQLRHALILLAGKVPGDSDDVPEFNMDAFLLPQELPLTLPSELAQQRPDVRAAQAMLRAAAAQVGVATAQLYPRITLSGAWGVAANQAEDLFDPEKIAWNIGAGLVQPVFNGGALRAEQRRMVAVYDEAFSQYRHVVLSAFRDVADVLRALEADASALKAQSEAESVAGASLELVRKQFEAGAASHMVLLDAQRRHQQVKIGCVQARASRLADTAALFQALGGGWWKGDVHHD